MLTDVVETLQVRDSGIFLSRRICVNEDARRNLGVEVTRGSAGRIRILSVERKRELERVAAYGDVVWPPDGVCHLALAHQLDYARVDEAPAVDVGPTAALAVAGRARWRPWSATIGPAPWRR